MWFRDCKKQWGKVQENERHLWQVARRACSAASDSELLYLCFINVRHMVNGIQEPEPKN